MPCLTKDASHGAMAVDDSVAPSALAALAAATLIALSHPPYSLDWLAWVAFVPLLFHLHRVAPAGAFLLGATAWLPLSVAVGIGFAHASWPLAAAYPLASSAIVGLVIAGQAALLRRGLRPLPATLALPSLWVVGEQVGMAIGIPWGCAVTQVPRLPVLQTASLLGGSAISFLVLLVNGALAETAQALRAGSGLRRAAAPVATAALLLGACCAWGTWRLAHATSGPALRVASIQPLLPSELYTYQWLNPTYRQTVRRVVAELSDEAAATHPDFLIWPENGNGQFNLQVPVLRRAVAELAVRSGSALLLSSYEADGGGLLYNAVFSVAPDGTVLGRSAKTALVPGREEGFAPGSELATLPTPHGPVGALVCLESCFPWAARELTARGADILLVTTSDVAMRHSIPPRAHDAMAVLRAVENGRWLIQASNGGPSFIASPFGELMSRTPLLTRTVLHGRVERRRERTPYTRFGDWPLRGVIAGILLAALGAARSGRAVPARAARTGIVAGVVAIPTATALGLVLGAASLGFIAGGRPDLGGWWGGAVRAFVEPPRVEVPRDAGAEFIQGAPNTCGLAALAYSLNLLGFDTREADLLARVSPSPEGASMADLVALARAEGLVAWGERQDVTALRSIPKPVLAHVDDRHWVVVLAFDGDEVQLFDPAHGHTTLSVSDFTRRWGGHALLLRLPSYDDAASVHAAGIGTEQRPHGG